MTKKCSKCGVEKPMEEFYWRKTKKGSIIRHGICIECKIATQRAYAEEHSEKIKVKQKEFYEKNKKHQFSRFIQRRYGMTLGNYNELILQQGGLCPICDVTLTPEARPSIDHCHETGNVRNILCADCNLGLGQFRENPKALIKAALYVNIHRAIANKTIPT